MDWIGELETGRKKELIQQLMESYIQSCGKSNSYKIYLENPFAEGERLLIAETSPLQIPSHCLIFGKCHRYCNWADLWSDLITERLLRL